MGARHCKEMHTHIWRFDLPHSHQYTLEFLEKARQVRITSEYRITKLSGPHLISRTDKSCNTKTSFLLYDINTRTSMPTRSEQKDGISTHSAPSEPSMALLGKLIMRRSKDSATRKVIRGQSR